MRGINLRKEKSLGRMCSALCAVLLTIAVAPAASQDVKPTLEGAQRFLEETAVNHAFSMNSFEEDSMIESFRFTSSCISVGTDKSFEETIDWSRVSEIQLFRNDARRPRFVVEMAGGA